MFNNVALIAESNESQDSLNVTMNAAFNGGMTSGNLDLSAGRTSIFQNSKMTVFSLGGAAEATVKVLNAGSGHLMDSLKVYLEDGANYSKNSPAYPISFIVKYLKSDDIAKLGVAYKYNVPICTKNPRQVKSIKFNFITTTDDKDHEEGVFASITKRWELNCFCWPVGLCS